MADILRKGMLLGMGNPLLDISAQNCEDLLEKYGLEANNQILAEEKHRPMYKEMVDKYDVEYFAGGATQNTMRILQWMVGVPHTTAFMGCIGKDDFGQVLEKEAKSAGINVRYQYNSKEPTGTCAVLLTSNGANRSLCANLGAANVFSEEHLDQGDNFEIVKSAQFYYISGFFITVSPNTILRVAKHANEFNKVFSINLSAPFICEFFKEPLMKIIPYADIIFGNESEASEFAKHQKFEEEKIPDIALRMSKMEKANDKRSRMVVITQGSDQIAIAYEGKVNLFNPTKVPDNEIVDTNGAGDAFVAGFLSQYIQDKTTEECVKGGVYAATVVIKRSGVTVPEKNDFKL